mmetsp:Transcript_45778/g.82887  ORF Transcript_45778/g.82887 Transcript_45778/m.82887 type:complete len:222 (-) Transcript_45778:56-721(-)
MVEICKELVKEHHSLFVLGKLTHSILYRSLPLGLLFVEGSLVALFAMPNPLVYELELHLTARVTPDHVAKACATLLFYVLLHSGLITQLIADLLIGLLRVPLAAISSLLVEIANCWPTTISRALVPAECNVKVLLLVVNVCEGDHIMFVIHLSYFVPGRSLPLSETSVLRVDPSYEHRLPLVNLLSDDFLEISGSEPLHSFPMPGWVDGLHSSHKREQNCP